MHIYTKFLGLILALTLISGTAGAQSPTDQPHAAIRLLSPVVATGKGASVDAAIEVKLVDGWKTYWRTPGDAGLAPTFDWAGSENLASATVSYPVPHRFTTFDLDNYGYHGTAVFPVKLNLTEAGKAVTAKLKLGLLVCSDICIPETYNVDLSLPSGESAPSENALWFDAAKTAVAVESESFISAWLESDIENKTNLVVLMKTDAAPSSEADLFVEHASSASFAKPIISYDATAGIATFKTNARTAETLAQIHTALSAAPVAITFVDDNKGIEGKVTLQAAPEVAEIDAPATLPLAKINLELLAFALIGGLILNLMPCVLPVLSLKVLSVMSHGGKDNRKTIFRNFMASAAGIIFSFWLMAGVLTGMKLAGASIGWGIQFQHPGFLIFMIVVVMLFAVNMWGLFEIPLPRFIAHRIGKRQEEEPTLLGHFLTGAFATLLATPCTAPFLGTAVGFALAGGSIDIFVIFTFLGLGLALPYIVLALSPKLFKHMPKPGKWMLTLRKILALALVGTALWLGSVLFTISTQATLDAGWEKFDAALIVPAVNEGKTVIVDVTADWCLTCKANKRLVLEQQDVIDAIAGENILRLQADWTHHDESIAAFLKTHGKYGIPFNIVYGPGAPKGIVLPELLTKRAVTDALIVAAGE